MEPHLWNKNWNITCPVSWSLERQWDAAGHGGGSRQTEFWGTCSNRSSSVVKTSLTRKDLSKDGFPLAHSLKEYSHGGRSGDWRSHGICNQEAEEMDPGAQLNFSFWFSLGPQSMGWCRPHLKCLSTWSEARSHGDSKFHLVDNGNEPPQTTSPNIPPQKPSFQVPSLGNNPE